jgi:ABC-2 type transport system permease protein
MLVVSAIGGLAYLAIGQFIVAVVKGSDAVNAAARLVYFPLAIVGALGEIGLFGTTLQKIVTWSPFGTTKTLIAWSLDPSTWNMGIFWALIVTLAYAIFFTTLGIKKFKWSVQ